MTLYKGPLENTVEKGENAGNQNTGYQNWIFCFSQNIF